MVCLILNRILVVLTLHTIINIQTQLLHMYFMSRGGYLIKPDVFEFWQGQTNRLHDRIRYRKLQPSEQFNEKLMHKGEGDYVIERLSS